MSEEKIQKKSLINKITEIISGFIKQLKEEQQLPLIRRYRSFASAIFLVLLMYLLSNPFASSAQNIPTYTVSKDKFLVTINESGEIRAKNSVSISTPRVRGSLKVVYLVPEGNIVDAGDTIVQFDPTEAINGLREAEARMEIAISEKEKLLANQKTATTRAESELKSAELSYELSKLNLEQMRFEAEVKQQEAKLQHQRNELTYLKAKQELESQKIIQRSELNKVEIDIKQRQADLERARRDLEQLTLTAPTDGLAVYETNWSTGRKIAIGDTPWPGMTLISLPDLSAMQSISFINEVDVSRVRRGLPVEVRLDAFPDSIFKATIASVASLGKSKDGNSSIKVFEIAIDILAVSEILKPGMTTGNKIIISEIPNVLFVPQEAVFDKHDKKIVYLQNGSGFDEMEVTIGDRGEDYIVIQSGIEVGDKIALRDPTIKVDANSDSDQLSVPSTE